MCYDGEAQAKMTLTYAIHRAGSEAERKKLQTEYDKLWGKELFPLYHVSGFAHPKIQVFTDKDPYKPQAYYWGLIPNKTKTKESALKSRQNCLNARGETIFTTWSFKDSAKSKRCLVYFDSFYEHHHVGKGTVPFRIYMKDQSPMVLAGLWDEWVDVETGEIVPTFTIVTTVGNPIMSKIHNNPKAEMGPRMPVILLKDKQDVWLDSSLTEAQIKDLIKPIDESLLAFNTVGRLRGKNAVGNKPEVVNEVKYSEVTWY